MARDRCAFPCILGVVPVDGTVGIGPSTLSIDHTREYATEPRLPVDSRRRRIGRVSCNDPTPLLCTTADLLRTSADLQPLCSDVSSEHCSFLGGCSADVPPGLSVGVDFQSNLQLLDGMAYRNPSRSRNSYSLRAAYLRAAYLWAATLRNLDLWGPDLWSARRGSGESHGLSAYVSSTWLSTYRLPADDLLITGVS